MKRLFVIMVASIVMWSCNDKYTFDTNFTLPTELEGPTEVTLDVTSFANIVLSWTGGGATDGGIVLYNVLFDKADGDFTSPLSSMPSDLGAGEQLTISHAQLNAIARSAGIAPEQTGTLKWSVTAGKGGEVKSMNTGRNITVTRGEGIDNYPTELYLYGSGAKAANETEGRQFRNPADGVFVIYTSLVEGEVEFKSSPDADAAYYYSDNGKLKEGNNSTHFEATAQGEVARITLDFNTLSVKKEIISNVEMVWGVHPWTTFRFVNSSIEYQGNGVFASKGVECATFFYDWGWAEERYRFYVVIDGVEGSWGRLDEESGESRPTPGVTPNTYYRIGEWKDRADWSYLWKMASQCEGSRFDVTIYTNKDNMMYHEFTNFASL